MDPDDDPSRRDAAARAAPDDAPDAEVTSSPGVELPTRSYHTVETLVRARVAAQLGGPRGGLEVALPFALFTLVYVVFDVLVPALVTALVASVLLYVARLVQGSSTRFVRHGLAGIAAAAVLTLFTGQAEDAFLLGIVQAAGWAVVLAGSIVVRRPLVGYLIGAVLGDTDAWRHHPAILRLADRLTVVMLAPMALRVAVQLPLYLTGSVGWLGVSKIVLGWPLSLVAFIVAAGVLARGETPLDPAQARNG